ncbi:MAG: nucleoside hydrolase [Oscillospiraceae bacterium]|nr:nucleoside hydrolase [Oscillospiraceae bacterium]
MIKAVFDCDPGHDDIIALMTALAHPEAFKVAGAVTVAGNQTLDKVTDNLLRVLDHLGIDLPVFRGSARPLCRQPEPQPGAHGESGLDGPKLAPALSKAGSDGVDFLRRTLLEGEEKTLVFALGPLTNLALLLGSSPAAAKRIERIELMGGSLYSGNILPRAEFNIYHDPEAAKLVFASGEPIVMSGLEVCAAASVLHSEYPRLKKGGRASRLAFELLEFFSLYGKKRGSDRSPVFDLTCVIHALRPELFESEFYHIDIETAGELCRGMTVADLRAERDRALDTCEVLTGVDREGYVKVFFESMAALDDMLA